MKIIAYQRGDVILDTYLVEDIRSGAMGNDEILHISIEYVKGIREHHMSNKSRSKKHHYVPRWYLERFTDTKTGMLSVYDLKKNEWREQKPGEVMCIKHHNRQEWAPKGVDPNIFENALGEEIENPGKMVIDKLIENPRTLSADDMALLITYLHLQRIRVPRQASIAKDALKEFLS